MSAYQHTPEDISALYRRIEDLLVEVAFLRETNLKIQRQQSVKRCLCGCSRFWHDMGVGACRQCMDCGEFRRKHWKLKTRTSKRRIEEKR